VYRPVAYNSLFARGTHRLRFFCLILLNLWLASAVVAVRAQTPSLPESEGPAPFDSNVPRLRVDPMLSAPKPSQKEGANFLRADEIDGDKKNGWIEARGNVNFRNRFEVIRADWARFNEATSTVDAKGNVRWRSQYDTVVTDSLTYNTETERGRAGATDFTLSRFGGKGKAEQLRFEGPGKYGVDRGTYTTCKSDSPMWCLHVDKMDIDSERDVGVAKGARLLIYDTPVFYLPSFDFPLGKERKSGFLAPSYGSTGTRGLELQLPYYLNLAPNYDATVTPRLMTKRGLEIGTEFRYLFDNFSGTFTGEVLPRDRIADATRSRVWWRHAQNLAPGLTFALDAQRVSDDTYFVDLAERVTATALTTLPRFAALSYTWDDWNFAARVQKFQSLQDPTAIAPFTPPYEKVPELSAAKTWRNLFGFELEFNSAVTRFEHPFLVPGVRSLAVTKLRYPWRSPGAFIVPQFTFHASDYRVDTKDVDFKDSTRLIPFGSLDAGLFFDREATLFGRRFTQTLEPRLFYTVIPFKDQSRIPNFDSAPIDFNYTQLFQENRYSGNDRIGDTNELTLAVSTRYLDPQSGRERLRLSIGERFYFDNQQVSVGETVRERRTSDALAILGVRPNDALNLEAVMQFNTNASRTERATLSGRYSPEPRKVISGSYRYIRELVENGTRTQVKQVDVAAQWPLADLIGNVGKNWYGVGRVNYSVPERRVVEGVAGFEYDGECWIGRLVAQRVATGVQRATNAVFWQIELNGLSRIGTNPLDVLRRNIPGYQTLNTLETGRRRAVTSDVYEPID
jgi:LPS-assembly protein